MEWLLFIDNHLNGHFLEEGGENTQKIIVRPIGKQHAPYFLTRDATRLVNAPGVLFVDTVEKYDALARKKSKFHRVFVEKPTYVIAMREVVEAYEDHIPYVYNFLFDSGLTPMMPIDGGDPFTTPAPQNFVSIDIEVANTGNIPDPEKALEPIIAISIYDNNGSHVLLSPWYRSDGEDSNNVGNNVLFFNTEKELLEYFVKYIQSHQLVATFNGENFDIPYLKNRCKTFGIEFPEVVDIDLYLLAKAPHIKNYVLKANYADYTLDSVANAFLGVGKIQHGNFMEMTASEMAKYNARDSELVYNIIKKSNMLMLLTLFSRISYTFFPDVVTHLISFWIKNMMFKEHRKRGWLIPKMEILNSSYSTTSIIKGKKYKGAIVFNPPTGVFYNVVVLDFASLYPTAIKVYNLSYETMDVMGCQKKRDIRDENGDVVHTVCDDSEGIMSNVVGKLRDTRIEFKHKNDEFSQAVQMAMKVFINASYGVFGADTFPLYSPAMAESVTSVGRNIITNTKKHVEELNCQVIYGDTDSLFITGENVQECVKDTVKWVKEKYNFDIEVDKEYEWIIFSGRKKNYFGMKRGGKLDIKGLGLKKRNTPVFMRNIESQLKAVKTPDELRILLVNMVKDMVKKLYHGDYNLDELAFTVMLSKDLDEYKVETEHVECARMLQMAGYNVTNDTLISYIKTPNGAKPVQLAHLKEVDKDKYIEHIQSTFEPILEGLGVDVKSIIENSRNLSILDFTNNF